MKPATSPTSPTCDATPVGLARAAPGRRPDRSIPWRRADRGADGDPHDDPAGDGSRLECRPRGAAPVVTAYLGTRGRPEKNGKNGMSRPGRARIPGSGRIVGWARTRARRRWDRARPWRDRLPRGHSRRGGAPGATAGCGRVRRPLGAGLAEAGYSRPALTSSSRAHPVRSESRRAAMRGRLLRWRRCQKTGGVLPHHRRRHEIRD